MKTEIFRKDAVSSEEFFQARRWEGKPLHFKFKYAVANFTEIWFSLALVSIVGPLMYIYRYNTEKNTEKYALTKFKRHYTVVRDDDPNVENIKKEKEYLKKFFPC